MNSLHDACRLFRNIGSARCHLGILLLDDGWLGRELDLSVRLNADCTDLPHSVLAVAHPDARYLGLDWTRVADVLNRLASSPRGQTHVLVVNADLVISALTQDERRLFWEYLLESFPHRRRTLAITLPVGAAAMLPQASAWHDWQATGRVANVRWLD